MSVIHSPHSNDMVFHAIKLPAHDTEFIAEEVAACPFLTSRQVAHLFINESDTLLGHREATGSVEVLKS